MDPGKHAGMQIGIGELESRWAVVDGRRMHARVSTTPAPAGSPMVVLVHGLVVSSRYMIPTAEKLAPHHEVYVPDRGSADIHEFERHFW